MQKYLYVIQEDLGYGVSATTVSVVYFFNFIFLLDSWRRSIFLVLHVLWQHFLSGAVGFISDMSR